MYFSPIYMKNICKRVKLGWLIENRIQWLKSRKSFGDQWVTTHCVKNDNNRTSAKESGEWTFWKYFWRVQSGEFSKSVTRNTCRMVNRKLSFNLFDSAFILPLIGWKYDLFYHKFFMSPLVLSSFDMGPSINWVPLTLSLIITS